jgi:hypothetical protein
MDEEEIKRHLENINAMSHEELCRTWRFAPSGHPYFDKTLPLYEVFKKRLDDFGGFTPEISKKIGWE